MTSLPPELTPTKILLSKRRSIALQINSQGEFIVRAPLRTPIKNIESLILQKQSWILKCLQRKAQGIAAPELSELEIKHYKKLAKIKFKNLLDIWAQTMELTYSSVRISSAKSRWGSCSGKNSISLNWRLVLMPESLLEYVVIHELAHVKHKNHSIQFWEFVAKYLPEYKSIKKQLTPYQNWLF